jgi:hypothetical protein
MSSATVLQRNQAAVMRYLYAMAMMAALVVPASAQFSQGNQKTPLQLQYEKQEADQKENERLYNEQMKRLKAQAPARTSNDPWSKVRSAPDTTAKR